MIYSLIMAIENPTDREFIAQLYNEYKNKMLETARAILQNNSLAEEATHDAFVRIIDNVEKFTALNCKDTRDLIVIIIRSICFDMLRRSRIIDFIEFDDETEYCYQYSPEELLLKEETVDSIFENIDKLGNIYADVLKLKLNFDYSADKIAKLLGISPENVWVRFHRGKKKIIKLLEKEGILNE